jgi:ATP-binding cassette subfamily B protein
VLLRKVMPLFVRRKRQLLLALVLLLIITASQLAGPLVLKYIIDTSLPNGDLTGLLYAAGIYIIIAGGGAGVGYLQAVHLFKLGISVVTELKARMFEHILRLGLDFHEENAPGKLLSRVESDAETLQNLFSNVAVELARSSMLFVGILAVLAWQNFQIAVWIMGLIPVVFLATWVYFTKMRPIWRETRVQNAIVTGYVSEYVQGIEVIQQYNYEPLALERMRAVNEGKYKADITAQMREYYFWGAFSYTEIIAIIIVLVIGVKGVVAGLMTLGTLVLFIEYVRALFEPIMTLSEQLNMVNRSFISIERVFGILETEPSVKDVAAPPMALHKLFASEQRAPSTPAATVMLEQEAHDSPDVHRQLLRDFSTIRFENVWFAYESGADGESHWILRDVSLTLHRGERMALVGASGGGKSTIVKLLLRFHDPQLGRITVDGRDIRDIALSEWRALLGLVLQDIYLFPGTVLDNLRAFNSAVPRNQVERAIRAAQAEELVRQLPQGLDGVLAERGANLSVGERQLLSFARALVADPALLVLDEATSSVDPHTERKVQAALEHLLEGRTAVIVAHRLSTILSADQILLLHKGELAEQGRHHELLALDGLYAKLFRLQFGDMAGVDPNSFAVSSLDGKSAGVAQVDDFGEELLPSGAAA